MITIIWEKQSSQCVSSIVYNFHFNLNNWWNICDCIRLSIAFFLSLVCPILHQLNSQLYSIIKLSTHCSFCKCKKWFWNLCLSHACLILRYSIIYTQLKSFSSCSFSQDFVCLILHNWNYWYLILQGSNTICPSKLGMPYKKIVKFKSINNCYRVHDIYFNSNYIRVRILNIAQCERTQSCTLKTRDQCSPGDSIMLISCVWHSITCTLSGLSRSEKG